MSEINDIELVIIGNNLPHCWKTFNCKSKKIIEITIQFHKDLIDEKFLRRNQTHFIKEMFHKANKGVLFSKSISQLIIKRLKEIAQKKGFDSVLELLSILNDLSKSKNMKVLSVANYSNSVTSYNSRRIEKVIEFLNTQYDKKITLKDAAKIANMSEVSFSRFFKANTGISFIDNLIDIRLGHASRLLIDTNYSINEIAYSCGFNNISNFNRLFKKKKNYAPKKFREDYTNESRVFI